MVFYSKDVPHDFLFIVPFQGEEVLTLLAALVIPAKFFNGRDWECSFNDTQQ